jgi:hypothetical protein
MIKQSKQAAYQLVQKLASYFKVPKTELSSEVFADPNWLLLHFDSLYDKHGLDIYFYCTEVNKFNLAKVLNIDKFLASDMYEQFVMGESATDGNPYIMSIYLTGMLWFIYRSTFYDGIGGIFVSDGKSGFVITPATNYLKKEYPKTEY